MSPRPYWKGYLKLSLVSCPIALHAASSSAERVTFRQINRTEGLKADRPALSLKPCRGSSVVTVCSSFCLAAEPSAQKRPSI